MELPNDPDSSLADLLPALNEAGKNNSKFWSLPVNFSDSGYFSAALEAIVERQEEILNIGIQLLEIKTLTDIKNVAKLRGQFNDSSYQSALLTLIQIHLTYIPLQEHSLEKRLVKALTWIGYGLGDNFEQNLKQSQQQTFYPEIGMLYAKFPESQVSVVAGWFGFFYYVWRALGCDYNVGCSQIDAALHSLNRCIHSGEIYSWANKIGYLVCWLAHYEHEESQSIVNHIESIYCSSILDDYTSLRLLEVLSTQAGRYSSKPSQKWARIALDKHNESMSDFQRFVFLASVIQPDAPQDYVQFYPRFLNALKQVMTAILKTPNNSIHEEARRSITAETITPLLGNLIKMNKGDAALEVLLVWYGQPPRTLQNSVLVVGNDMSTLLACIDNLSHISKERTKEEHQHLIMSMNKFLGVSCSISGNRDFKPNQPEQGRFGVPSESESDEYLKSITAYYKLSELGDFISTNVAKRMIFIPGEHHPIQFTLMNASRSCIPLNTSLTIPYNDRKIEKICLVSAANSITEETEISLITSIFNQLSPDVSVDVLRCKDATKSDFLKTYSKDDHDIIWIMSHDEFDHWNPEDVEIEIFGETIGLNEIISTKINLNRNQRRLLFLNVCDGATTRSTGSISRIGFGPMLASRSQCVVSHLWPTNPYAALSFGAWFAVHLCEDDDFFSAYKNAIEGMISKQDKLLKRLSELGVVAPDATDRIQNNSIDTSLLAHGGSVAFFE